MLREVKKDVTKKLVQSQDSGPAWLRSHPSFPVPSCSTSGPSPNLSPCLSSIKCNTRVPTSKHCIRTKWLKEYPAHQESWISIAVMMMTVINISEDRANQWVCRFLMSKGVSSQSWRGFHQDAAARVSHREAYQVVPGLEIGGKWTRRPELLYLFIFYLMAGLRRRGTWRHPSSKGSPGLLS